METTKLKVGGREFALAFTLDTMCDLQEKIENFDLAKLSKYVRDPRGLLDLIYSMASQGERLEGRELDVDKRWFGVHITPAPGRIAKIQIAVLNALTAGLNDVDDGDQDSEGEEK